MSVRWDAIEDTSHITQEEAAVLSFARDIETGIYAAYACVEDGADTGVYKVEPARALHLTSSPQVAMSVGWNPTFADLKYKTIEPWILHDYDEDFYGCAPLLHCSS